jgi:hypothetical protein
MRALVVRQALLKTCFVRAAAATRQLPTALAMAAAGVLPTVVMTPRCL